MGEKEREGKVVAVGKEKVPMVLELSIHGCLIIKPTLILPTIVEYKSWPTVLQFTPTHSLVSNQIQVQSVEICGCCVRSSDCILRAGDRIQDTSNFWSHGGLCLD